MTHFKLSPKQKAARVFSYLFMALCVLVALFPIRLGGAVLLQNQP